MKHFLLEGEHLVPFEQRAPELIAKQFDPVQHQPILKDWFKST